MKINPSNRITKKSAKTKTNEIIGSVINALQREVIENPNPFTADSHKENNVSKNSSAKININPSNLMNLTCLPKNNLQSPPPEEIPVKLFLKVVSGKMCPNYACWLLSMRENGNKSIDNILMFHDSRDTKFDYDENTWKKVKVPENIQCGTILNEVESECKYLAKKLKENIMSACNQVSHDTFSWICYAHRNIANYSAAIGNPTWKEFRTSELIKAMMFAIYAILCARIHYINEKHNGIMDDSHRAIIEKFISMLNFNMAVYGLRTGKYVSHEKLLDMYRHCN